MSTAKLPVKTYKLKTRKKIGLFIFTISNLLVMLFFLNLGLTLIKSPGRFLCMVMVLWSLMMTVFGIIAIVYLIREKFIGFFISGDGLNDISTGHNYGVIMWKDVTKIRIVTDIENLKYKYIVLKVRNPQDYIDRETSGSKKRSMMLKLHYYGSPICFSNRGLNCSFEELENTVREYYENFQQRMTEKAQNNQVRPINQENKNNA